MLNILNDEMITDHQVGKDRMLTDHQVGKDKAASVTGEDVVPTELLSLPEAL